MDLHDVAATLRSIVEKTEPCLDLVVFWNAFGHPFGLAEFPNFVDRFATVGLDSTIVVAAVVAEGGFVAEGGLFAEGVVAASV